MMKMMVKNCARLGNLRVLDREDQMQIIKGFGWSATGFSWQGYKAWFLFFCYDSQWKKCPASKDEVEKMSEGVWSVVLWLLCYVGLWQDFKMMKW